MKSEVTEVNLLEVLLALLLQVEQLPLAELPQQEVLVLVLVLVLALALAVPALELLLAVEVQARALAPVVAQVLEVELPPR